MSKLTSMLVLLIACSDHPPAEGKADDTPDLVDSGTTPPRGPPPRLAGDVSAIDAPARIDAPDGVQIFGSRFGGAGDVDADGVVDLLVGAPADTNAVYYGELHGKMWLVPAGSYEAATTVDAVAVASVAGSRTEDQVGVAVAHLGDWNDDGFADFALGAPGTHDTDGQVGLVYGPLQGHLRLDTLDARLHAPVGTRAGSSLITGADLTGDGRPDLTVVSSTSSEHGREEVWVIADPVVEDADLDAVAAAHLTFPSAAHGTIIAANAGDLDGDGLPTLAVLGDLPSTLYLFDAPLVGTVGPDAATATLPLDASLGASVRTSDAGDSDGDGYTELPVAVQYANDWEGAAFLIGQPADPTGELSGHARATLTRDGAAGVGADIAFVGDLDGDGLDDLAVSALHDSYDAWIGGEAPMGVVYLLYGPVVGEVDLADAHATIRGEAGDDAHSVERVGDLDGDGFDDLAIGAPFANVRDGATGSLYLFLGGTSP